MVHTAENTYIVMELLSGGELFNRIVDKGCYPEKEAAELFAQICISLDYLHSRDIVRRALPITPTHAQEKPPPTEYGYTDYGYILTVAMLTYQGAPRRQAREHPLRLLRVE